MTDGPETDGRRAKGARRRRLLLDATMRVIGRAGVSAVSQRVVAREAGLPASAVTYYFPTVDELLDAALVDVNDGYIEALDRCASRSDPLAALAELVAPPEPNDRPRAAAECELFLLAGRRPSMRAEYVRWIRSLDAFLASYIDDPTRLAAASAAVDGLFLRCYCAPDTLDRCDVQAILTDLVRG